MKIKHYRDRDEWREDRVSGIGASEAAAALGLSPWMSRFELFAIKTGRMPAPDLSDNEAVEFGTRLEKVVAEAFADRTGRRIEMWPQDQVAVHDDHLWMRCTPDAIQFDEEKGEGLLQIKTTSAWNAKEWDGDESPLHYQIQCMTELAVTGHTWGSLACLIGGQKLVWVDFERNQKFIDTLIPNLQEFWRIVQAREEPPITSDRPLAIAQVLSKLHPNDSGEMIELPPDAEQWTADLEEVKEKLKRLEEEKAALENNIKHALGDATYGLLTDGRRWAWKTQTRASYVVKESSFRVLRLTK